MWPEACPTPHSSLNLSLNFDGDKFDSGKMVCTKVLPRLLRAVRAMEGWIDNYRLCGALFLCVPDLVVQVSWSDL